MDVARTRRNTEHASFGDQGSLESGEIGQDAAAELLGMSVRSFQRGKDRCEAEGKAGLVDRRAVRRRGGRRRRKSRGCSGSTVTSTPQHNDENNQSRRMLATPRCALG